MLTYKTDKPLTGDVALHDFSRTLAKFEEGFQVRVDFVSSQEFATVTVTSSWSKLSPSSNNNYRVEMIGTSTSPDKVGDRSWQLVLILH
jgi:hypothetical protein